jgi:CO/xanthine dehydrogenase FAD-binding subunit
VQPLSYHAPTTLADAIGLLASEGARLLAGGTDLVPQMREGRRQVTRVVDVKRIGELTAIEPNADGGWRLGAAASIGRLARHGELVAAHPGLVESACLIGSLQIQNRATLGGNLCNAAPSADAVPLLVALGAEVEIAGPAGTRTALAASLPTAPGRTMLQAGEIVTAIRLPPLPARTAARYLRMTPRREMDIAVAGAGAVITLDPSTGTISRARVVLASVAPTPLLAPAAAKVLVGRHPSRALFQAAGEAAAGDARPISDTRGSADYRRHLVAVLTRRALERCAADLGIALA